MSRKRWMVIGGLVLSAIVLSSVVWSLRDDVAYAQIAAGYAAKTTCSCLHVSARSLDSCLADLPEDARGNFTITEDADRVRASVLFGAISAEAIYEDGFGCRIEN
ncbi:hypothetical protein [Terricaulis silvestris]|uniref:Uncharacterized protein n=1 Tax=Terricaulis silvestris TaxID=2686094 RepID=A0A6I6MUL5_9CAUL|nr:hypothetical protein [Terricaulis silvestris]QGZ96447.1 hypothetical protein DSM104635_03307 [Terricaulis silvestris]